MAFERWPVSDAPHGTDAPLELARPSAIQLDAFRDQGELTEVVHRAVTCYVGAGADKSHGSGQTPPSLRPHFEKCNCVSGLKASSLSPILGGAACRVPTGFPKQAGVANTSAASE